MEKQSNPKKSSWIKGKCVGKGAFGTVSLAVDKSDGNVFAVKSVDLATCLPSQLECLENEIRILRSLSSPYVVEYLGDDVTRYGSTAMSCRNLHMEYMKGGTVVDVAVMKQRLGELDERILRWYTRSLLLGLKYVHGQDIVHCDVKGKNVLVGSDFTSVKLADFGSAIVKESAVDRWSSATITPRGSPLWMAPEVLRGEYQGPESDVWSFGCTIIEMVTGKPAWEDQGLNSLTRIANSDELPPLPAQLSELGRDFVDKCLRRDRKQRWSCDQLLQHPFVASASSPSKIGEPSPRCVLDFGSLDFEKDESTGNLEASSRDRISKLASEGGVVWESDGWMAVRNYAREEGTSTELNRTKEETEGTSWVHCGSVGMIRLGMEGTNSETTDCFDGTNSVDSQFSNYKVTSLKWSSGCRCRKMPRKGNYLEDCEVIVLLAERSSMNSLRLIKNRGKFLRHGELKKGLGNIIPVTKDDMVHLLDDKDVEVVMIDVSEDIDVNIEDNIWEMVVVQLGLSNEASPTWGYVNLDSQQAKPLSLVYVPPSRMFEIDYVVMRDPKHQANIFGSSSSMSFGELVPKEQFKTKEVA